MFFSMKEKNFKLTQRHNYTLKNVRLKKKTQLEKAHFIKVNNLKLTQVEISSFFHFMCVAANASKLF